VARYALGIEYDGSAYCGWQRQDHSPSIQEPLELALSKVADESIVVHASGRTDTGVHAWQQCVHFDSASPRELKAWVMGVNANLPDDISVRHVTPVSEDFHARYSTRGRTYRYLLLNHPARSALMANRVGMVHQKLDGCQAKHAVREITAITVKKENHLIMVQIEGNAFLHNMVRIVVGSLIVVGKGEQSPDWIASVLAARDRTLAGTTAVADGLYFMGPHYDPDFGIAHWSDDLPNNGFSMAGVF